MRILVIDDKKIHRDSAIETLKGHDVTTLGTCGEAYKLLNRKVDYLAVKAEFKKRGLKFASECKTREEQDTAREDQDRIEEELRPAPFDVVLTDMNMPASFDNCDEAREHQGVTEESQAPYGFTLALLAAWRGAKYVVMATDSNHHRDLMSASLDELSPGYWNDEPFGDELKVFDINGCQTMFVHTRFTGDDPSQGESKDWGGMLKHLMELTEVTT